ncbi:DUF6328 family protein [Planosporangium thailandense]|uniref:DUF6328 family protein n=1 Tax=Planosporangium thailandense TaxID=765197 RepID=UPI00197B1D83|nr:DUF6328 family protein [Planosporangium thailandense]
MAIQTGRVPTGARIGSDPAETHDLWNYRVRGETPTQRLDRCYTELLQEVRVAQTGVQVLLAFLLWVAFNPGFSSVTSYRRGLYVVALVLATLALALLIAPACANRVAYRRSLKAATLPLANRCAAGGMALLFASLNCVLVLILDVVLGSVLAAALGFTTVMWFAAWWYILPWTVLRRHSRRDASPATAPRRVDLLVAERAPGSPSGAPTSPRAPLVCRWRNNAGVLTAAWQPVRPSAHQSAGPEVEGEYR